MSKSFIYDSLGQKLQKALNNSDLPIIDTTMFTQEHCRQIRAQWYGTSNDDSKLKQQLVKVIMNGIIEEVRDKGNYYVFLIQVKYKAELYLIELKLVSFQWHFHSLQYVGDASRSRKPWIFGGIALSIGILLLVFATFISPTDDQSWAEELSQVADFKRISNSEDAQPDTAPALSLDDLKNKAAESDHIVLSKEEYHQLISNKSKAAEEQLSTDQSDKSRETMADRSEGEEVSITIRPGMSAHHVVQLFVEAGLVQDDDELKQLMARLNVNHKIRTGTYTIKTGTSNLDMIEMITNRQR